MHKLLKLSLLAASLLPTALYAQDVDRTKYPDYSDRLNPDFSLMKPRNAGAKATGTRPDHVNNAETPYFPPVFNQDGGSCGSASRICYMFTEELNAFRGTDASLPENQYPSHFVWLLTNGNSGKDQFVQFIGVPNVTTYGGRTYSRLFGNQNESNNDFGWMTGYDKWYSAMFNRMLQPKNFPVSVATEEGREAVKNYLWNHNGDTDFHAGGIVGIGVASGGNWQRIPSTPTNDEIGVSNKYYVKAWGTQVDHALTIVGYDDRIEFDLDGNGVYGEKAKDEVGAWIIVNSWGDGWCNNGFIYCPYKHAVPAFNADGTFPGNYWTPEIYTVRKNYRPLRTIKLKMDYSHRSELYLSAGVSADLNATEPAQSVAFEHFKYAGDGANGNTNPAPAVPMLGKWADGKLHDEPMEFGYDLTDLTEQFDPNMPLKYFFIVDTKSWAQGTGTIHEASIIDYKHDPEGVEVPFDLGAGGVTVENQGKRTVISVVVQGRGVYAPQNAAIADGVLSWQAPVKSGYTLTGYKVLKGGEVVGQVPAGTTTFTLPDDEVCSYDLVAVYGDIESSKVSVAVPATVPSRNEYYNIQKAGFSIPDVFGAKYEQATIEYWIKCNSLTNWNQSAGPGWGTFMFHANSDGRLTVGWNTTSNNRTDVSGAYSTSAWKHIAIVVNKNAIQVYVNGVSKTRLVSSDYSGIGGFGALTFTNNTGNNAYTDARMDEIRIWNTARTAAEIKDNYKVSFGDAGIPENLIAYFKGDLIKVGDEMRMRDHSRGGHHAILLGTNHKVQNASAASVTTPTDLSVKISQPTEPVYAGVPFTFTAEASLGAQTLKWNAEGAGVSGLTAISPALTFSRSGEQKVTVEATDATGATATDEITVKVADAPAPDAAFTVSKSVVPAGDHVTFLVNGSRMGYTYLWNLPGADVEEVKTVNAGATYQHKGKHTVTLTVTAPDGRKASASQDIEVEEVAPLAAFQVEPAVVLKGEMVKLIDKSRYAPNSWKWQLSCPGHSMGGEGEKLAFRPTQPGIYDVKLIASNDTGSSEATEEAGLVVCNADSKNGLNFAYTNAQVTPQTVPFVKDQNAFTIDWWMNPSKLESTGNGIGDKASTLLLTTNAAGALNVQINGRAKQSADGFIKTGRWHHYAVVLRSGILRFYRDGVQISSVASGVTKMPELAAFTLGKPEAPLAGQIDEFRVWSTALSLDDLKSYINQPLEGDDLKTAETAHGLKLYYQFNQSSGDCVDATSNGNTGVRSGFGPDGDAWGLSKGVFSLNFNKDETKTITAQYLTNYKEAFQNTGATVNSTNATRFLGLADWTIENAGLNTVAGKEEYGTGAHVDVQKKNDFTVTTGWDNFATSITNHKVYQTITLPAGAYIFTANYGAYEGAAKGCYLVAAPGKGLPDTAELGTAALGFTPMKEKSTTVTSNEVYFMLNEESEVSLGLVCNMSGQTCMTISSFGLQSTTYEHLVNDLTGIEDIPVSVTPVSKAIYDLSGRRVLRPVRGGVYIIGGQKVVLK